MYSLTRKLAGIFLLSALVLTGACVQSPPELNDIYVKISQIKLDIEEIKDQQKAADKKNEYALAQIEQRLESQETTLTAMRSDLERQIASIGGKPVPDSMDETDESGTEESSEADKLLRNAQEQYALGNYDTAIQMYEQYLREYPDSVAAPDAALRLGRIYYQQSDFEKARETFSMILEEYPASDKIPQVYHSKGICEIQMRKLDEARETLEKLRQTYPDYEPERVQQLMDNHL
ncbi:MAG: tetratricopeptide repeat protein [Candidatus Sumerlaeia bacterium]